MSEKNTDLEALKEENDFLKASLTLMRDKCNIYLKAIIDIHNIKEPKQFASVDDTVAMVVDLFEEWKEESTKSLRLQNEIEIMKHLKRDVSEPLDLVLNECESKMAIDRSEIAESELSHLIKLNEQRGKFLHPLFGACDDDDFHICSACIVTKEMAENLELKSLELLELRKLMRRSELVMLRVAWNRKMQNKEEICSTEKEAESVAEEMKTAIEK